MISILILILVAFLLIRFLLVRVFDWLRKDDPVRSLPVQYDFYTCPNCGSTNKRLRRDWSFHVFSGLKGYIQCLHCGQDFRVL